MAQVCDICAKGPIKARKITRRGKPKKTGGIGLNITGVHLRRQMPNLHVIRAMVGGSPKKLLVCTRCLRSGKVQKRPSIRKAPKVVVAAPAAPTAPAAPAAPATQA